MPAFARRLSISFRRRSEISSTDERSESLPSSCAPDAEGGFRLDVDEMLVIVDVEDGFERLDDAPDDDGRDLDRVAVVIVDLELAALEVAHAQRQPPAVRQRVDPPEARRL